MGIALVAMIIAINGIASLVEALWFAWLPGGGLRIVVHAIIALALLHRAHGIWELKPGAWLTTVLLLGLRTILALLDLIAAPVEIGAWINTAVVAVSLLYLTRPSVRVLFSRAHTD